ncbi:hypothetical protein NBRC116601_14970 [Cognatishimia sp. WU-CL00825]|uniref:UxaA family hydrolase n=1 Tax=Cognatishimia sp. WU-CL00825 TaxID=3127658 RepID=UPI003107EC51
MSDPLKTLSQGLLQLHPSDNISVLKKSVTKGSTLQSPHGEITISEALGMGHKVAITPIPQGSDVLKYGVPIGVASQDIARGDHVHLHNLSSRYTVIEDMEAQEND